MNETKVISVCIPYRRRRENLDLCLHSLSEQSLDASRFEVVIGAMDDDTDLKSLCAAWKDALDIVVVSSEAPFEISRARNLTLRAALGDMVLQTDADSYFDPDALQRLYRHEVSSGSGLCVLGQVRGYGNNQDGNVGSVEYFEPAAYRERLSTLCRTEKDLRFRDTATIPWAYVWTGFAAVPRRAVIAHDLFFDPAFTGWGVDDLEWGKRIAEAGLEIRLDETLNALHLPHARCTASNAATETRNFRRLLRKHPGRDVELVAAFNDIRANALHPQFTQEFAAIEARHSASLQTLRGEDADGELLLLGAIDGPGLPPGFVVGERHPYIGLATPFDDGCVPRVEIASQIRGISQVFVERMFEEANRIGRQPARWSAQPA